MPIPTELVLTVGGVALAIGSAAAYSALTGNSASVDYDDDGTDEITFDGDTGPDGFEGDQAIDPAYNEQIETEPSPYNNTPTSVTDGSPSPNGSHEVDPEVQEIGEDLVSITGIGPTRAQAFSVAGYGRAEDLWLARDMDLQEVDGIGPRAVEQIRSDIGGQYHDEGDE